MKQSVQLSDSIHILIYLATMQEPSMLKSAVIAESVQTNASNVRKIMGQLRRAGLVTSQQGKACPKLAKEPEAISLLDIFHSLEGENPLLMVDKNTGQDCPVGRNIQPVLQHHYQDLQASVEKEMAKISLAQLVTEISQKIQAEKGIGQNEQTATSD